MRFRPASRAVLAGASLIASWSLGDRPARADILVGSTLIPTSSVVTSSSYFPTSYVASSYIPTSYVVPTSTFLPTSSIIETGSSVYYPTSYVGRYRGGLFRPRRFVERTSYYGTSTGYLTPTAFYSSSGFVTPTSYLSSTYLPTSYVSSYIPTSYVVPTMATSAILPTTYLSSSFVAPTSYVVDSGLIATTASSASVCCDTSPAPMSAPVVNPTRTMAPARPMTSGNSITSQPTNSETSSRSTERLPSAAVSPNPADDGMNVPPPATPAIPPTPRPSDTSPPSPEKAEDVILPPAGGSKPQIDGATGRTSYKPSNYNPVRNILRGRVVSFETGRPEEAVPVVLTSRSKAFDDRTTLTDADGEFKISLPDGDWAVKVTMPSGSVYTVGRSVTASGGQVVDRTGRNVGEFVITR